MPAITELGYLIRKARRTYYKRLADRLETAATDLDHDPEVTLDGDYVCFAGLRIRFPEASRWLATQVEKE